MASRTTWRDVLQHEGFDVALRLLTGRQRLSNSMQPAQGTARFDLVLLESLMLPGLGGLDVLPGQSAPL